MNDVYLVLNWNTPIGVFACPERVVPFLRKFTEKWGKPFPDGALTVLLAKVLDQWDVFEDERSFRNFMMDVSDTFLRYL